MLSPLPHTLLERQRILTLLGIQCRDAADASVVTDSLVVTAWPEEIPFQRRTAFRTSAGIYAFQDLPGMRALERPQEDASMDLLDNPPFTESFVVEVIDTRNRFLPAVFRTDLPLATPGLFQFGNNADANSGLFLFSSPGRSAAPGWASVYANVRVGDTGNPASWVVLEVAFQDLRWIGIGNESGDVGVFFPYPAITTVLTGSPPEGSRPLHEHVWDVTIRVLYEPANLTFFEGTSTPSLESILTQAEATIRPTASAGAVSSIPASLPFRVPLELRSDPAFELLIETP